MTTSDDENNRLVFWTYIVAITATVMSVVVVPVISVLAESADENSSGNHEVPQDNTLPVSQPPAHMQEELPVAEMNGDTQFIQILLVIAVAIVVVLAVVALIKSWRSHQRKKEGYLVHQKEWDEVCFQLSAISASFTNAHIDPEFVLYKPLVISSAPQSQEFVDNLLSVRNFVESKHSSFVQHGKASNYEDFKLEEAQERVEKLNVQWRELNREAEKVGTPILDPAEVRRIERLWELAANESATTSERSQAMDKIVVVIEKSREKLEEQYVKDNKGIFGIKFNRDKESDDLYTYNNLLLDSIIEQIEKSKKQGIITAGDDALLAITS